MRALFFYSLAAFGLSYIVGHARVSLGLRIKLAPSASQGAPRAAAWRYWLADLIECPACLGTWIGFGVGALQPQLVPFDIPRWSAALALGFYTCAVGFLLGRLTGWLRED